MPDSKMQTYLLLRLERVILELRQQKLLSRNASGPILKWIDQGLSRQRSPLTHPRACLRLSSAGPLKVRKRTRNVVAI